METSEQIESIAILFLVMANMLFLLLYLPLKQADLWEPTKAFGVTVPNWSYHKSIRAFWQKRQQVDPQIRKTIYCYLFCAIGCFVLSLILLAVSLILLPVK
ncbi:hypothetical protein [uncultured Gimesia sp.]|jgi:hypothetical protein|uniref:hypothetical protein n=1 Tax=uncultured Gimesia sp. TaxID=1678688 RepID=UPI00260A02DF|nr:hypothetical protein [uncultured Gimesia sp.]